MEENKTNVTETKQEDKGLSQIQPNEKRSWWSIAFIWVGTMICIPMLMVGGMEAYTVVWDLGDVGIGLMTIFNLIALYPMSGEAITALRDYERRKHLTQN